MELHRREEPGGAQDPVQLLSGFPRRAFSEADMERPLQELGMACACLEQRVLAEGAGGAGVGNRKQILLWFKFVFFDHSLGLVPSAVLIVAKKCPS